MCPCLLPAVSLTGHIYNQELASTQQKADAAVRTNSQVHFKPIPSTSQALLASGVDTVPMLHLYAPPPSTLGVICQRMSPGKHSSSLVVATASRSSLSVHVMRVLGLLCVMSPLCFCVCVPMCVCVCACVCVCVSADVECLALYADHTAPALSTGCLNVLSQELPIHVTCLRIKLDNRHLPTTAVVLGGRHYMIPGMEQQQQPQLGGLFGVGGGPAVGGGGWLGFGPAANPFVAQQAPGAFGGAPPAFGYGGWHAFGAPAFGVAVFGDQPGGPDAAEDEALGAQGVETVEVLRWATHNVAGPGVRVRVPLSEIHKSLLLPKLPAHVKTLCIEMVRAVRHDTQL